MAESLGTAVLDLTVDPKELLNGMGDAFRTVVKKSDETAGEVRRNFSKGLALAGAASGAALAGGVVEAINVEKASDKLAAQLGANAKQSERLGRVAGGLYSNAYGDSLDDVNTALRGVVQNITGLKNVSNRELTTITRDVMNVASAFDQDLGMTTKAVGVMMRNGLARNAREAINVLTVGFQRGNNAGEDLLETVNEYSPLFRNVGLTGKEAMGLITQGMKAGARDSDRIADAIKEFSIRAVDGSRLTADGFRMIGLRAREMVRMIGRGGPEARRGLDMVLDGLRNMRDPVERSRAAVALFGTQAEDLGRALYSLDPSAAVRTFGDVGGAAERLDRTLNDNTGSAIEAFKRRALRGLADMAAKYAIPAISGLVAVIRPIAPILGPMAVATLAVVGAVRVWTVAQAALNVVLTANPIGIIVVALAGLVGALVLAYEKVGWFRTAVNDVWTFIKDNWPTLLAILTGPIGLAVLYIVRHWDEIKRATGDAWEWVKNATTNAWNAVKDFITQPVGAAFNWVRNAINNTKSWISGRWDDIKANANAAWQRVKELITNPINAAGDRVRTIIGGVRQWLSDRWEDIKSSANSAWQRVKELIGNPIDAARDRVQSIISNVKQWLSDRWGEIRERASDAWSNVRDAVINPIVRAAERVREIIGNVKDWLSDRWREIVDRVGDFGSNIKDKVESAFKNAANGVIGFVNKIIGAINKIPGIPDIKEIPLLAQGGKMSRASGVEQNVGFYAQGGKVTRPLAIVGEEAPRHPEYVIPTNPAYRDRAVALTSSLMRDLGMDGVPGFFLGGIIGGITGAAGGIFNGIKDGVAKVAGLPLGLLEMGAEWVLKQLPSADSISTDWLKGLGSYAIGKVTGWVKDKVKSLFEDDDNEGLTKIKRVARMGEQADKMDRMNTPYLYGGGHGSFAGPWDCSGAVSAILNAGGFLGSPVTTDGLKVWGQAGDGALFTVGVRGSTGREAHTMMRLGSRYFESGGGDGAGWRSGWNGHFPIHRFAPGFAQGGVLSTQELAAQMRDALIPRILGWGLARGGLMGGLPYAGNFGGGGQVGGRRGEAAWAIVHGGEYISEDVPQVHLHFDNGMEWLRQFVRVEIRQNDRESRGVFRAGVRP